MTTRVIKSPAIIIPYERKYMYVIHMTDDENCKISRVKYFYDGVLYEIDGVIYVYLKSNDYPMENMVVDNIQSAQQIFKYDYHYHLNIINMIHSTKNILPRDIARKMNIRCSTSEDWIDVDISDLNTTLQESCESLTIKFDRRILMDNVITPNFSDPFAMTVCLYKDETCISSIELKPLSKTDILLVWSSTHSDYENHNYNKFMRCVAIIICNRLGYTTLKSFSIHPTTTYVLMKYFQAIATINKRPIELLPYPEIEKLHEMNSSIDLTVSIDRLMHVENSKPLIYRLFEQFCKEIICYSNPTIDGGKNNNYKYMEKQTLKRKIRKSKKRKQRKSRKQYGGTLSPEIKYLLQQTFPRARQGQVNIGPSYARIHKFMLDYDIPIVKSSEDEVVDYISRWIHKLGLPEDVANPPRAP
jgi:hypothetical protein